MNEVLQKDHVKRRQNSLPKIGVTKTQTSDPENSNSSTRFKAGFNLKAALIEFSGLRFRGLMTEV